MEPADYLKIAASSAVIAACVSSSIGWLQALLRERGTRQHDRYHALLESAVALERFVKACGDTVSAEAVATQEAQARDSWEPFFEVTFPTFALPDNYDWKALAKDQAAQLKDFFEAAATVPAYISGYAQNANDAGEVAAEKAIEAAKFGRRAWKLAVAFRACAEIPALDLESLHYGWVHDAFKDRLKQHATFQERQRAMWEEFAKSAPVIQPEDRSPSLL
jgi:hypothetical protein